MKIKVLNFLKSHWSKIFPAFFFILLLSAYANIFAVFTPGQTLDPNCAPGAEGCIVEISGGSSDNPWLTGTSNIYHNGNVNVGDGNGNIEISTGGVSLRTYNPLTGIVGSSNDVLSSGSLDLLPSFAINNDGNPVIAFYISASVNEGPMTYDFFSKAEASGPSSSLYVLVCSDSICSDGTMTEVASGIYTQSGFKTIVKIGTDNIPRIVFENIENLYSNSVVFNYAICSDENCSSVSSTFGGDGVGIANIMNGYSDYNFSFSLDSNNNPYVLYNDNGGNSNYTVSLARYTGNVEDSCILGEIMNSYWKCSKTSIDLGGGAGDYLDGGVGDFMFISEEGYPRFITEHNLYDGNTPAYNYIRYNECNDKDCQSVVSTGIDTIAYNSGSSLSSLAVNSEGIPYILYGIYDSNDNYRQDLKIAYLNEGNGSGCSESSDWSCVTVSSLSNNGDDHYLYSDIKIGSDDLPQIVAQKYLYNGDTGTYSLENIKCPDVYCSNITKNTIFSQSDNINNSYYLSSLISLDENNNPFFIYIDADNYELKLTQIITGEDFSFGSGLSNLYTGGDLGVANNLFIEGKTILGGGVYLSDFEPDNTSNALYNVDGDLYWNGSLVSGGSSSIGPDLTLGTDGSISGSLNIASRYGGTTTITNNIDGCMSQQDIECDRPSDYALYLPSSSGILATEEYVYDSISNIPSSDSPIEIVNSSNLFSTGLGYSGSGVTAVTNSNFFGEYAGSVAINASYSNFLGYFAGYNAPSASYSNFLGHNAGYSATSASGSNFFGNSAGDSASSASNSNFFGTASGSGATNASYSNFFGFNAGNSASSASHSNFLGRNAGYLATNASYSNFFGYNAGQSASSASNSNFLGAVAGQSATNASNSNFLGVNAGQSATNASNSNFFGTNAGSHSPNAANSIFIGRDSGINSSINNTDTYNDLTTFANTSILIGHKTSTGNYSNSIAIGAYATNTATNQFMIGSTTRPINTTRFQGATTECTISTGTGIACTSDERLKTITSDLNIDPITKEEISVLDKLIKVKTVNFKWNDNPEGKNNIGFLAQDLYNYFPELINGDPENKEEYLSVYYSNMTPILVEAIREMNLKVGNLDTEIKKITINDLMSDFFGGAVDQVVEGVAYLKDIVVGTLKVGSPEKRTGITLYDEETGSPYCITIVSGEIINREGECGVIEMPDICPNIDEYQQEIPDGYELDENNECIEVYIEEKSIDLELEKKVDVCSNIEGIQSNIPEGYNLSGDDECIKQDLEIPVDPSSLSTATPSQE